jgi:glutamate-1-semialdehyde 2,1-aminomutase
MSQSRAIYEHAARFIPGGVSSTNRIVDPNLVFTRADGAYIYDADGKQYIDYHAAFGPPVLGHCHPEVNDYVHEALSKMDLVGVGTSEMEAQLAERVVGHIPSADQVMFCNSGSEATYAALRLARAVTGREQIIKFQGCYHGWHDAILMNIISPAERVGHKDPVSKGMTQAVIDNTAVLPFNDIEAVTQCIEDHPDTFAAIILEPIPHNIGCVMPRPEFLQALRDITEKHGIVLIFDEVITGFRHDLGGYQNIVDITPDLTTLGKAIANGYPLAALCGREDLMRHCAPGGDVFFAGTFNAHPVGVAASHKTIDVLERPESYRHLFALGDMMRDGLEAIYQQHGITATVAGFGSVFVTYFMEPPVTTYTDLLRNDVATFVQHRKDLIEHGIYQLPVNLKRNHISLAHTEMDVQQTLDTVDRVLAHA